MRVSRFVDDFDAGHGGVIGNGLEGEIDLAERRGADVLEPLGHDLEAARLLIYVEVPQQGLAIAEHVKYPAASPAAARESRAVEEFDEVQDHGVGAAGVDWNRVLEMPESL